MLRIDRGRSDNLRVMEQAHLERLNGAGVAADVGYIGYFSQAPICDTGGLVDGREFAKMTTAQRSAACVASKPAFLFLDEPQIDSLNGRDQLNSQTEWLDCGHVDFPNVRNTDPHWLMVRRSAYPQGCPAHL